MGTYLGQLQASLAALLSDTLSGQPLARPGQPPEQLLV